jgi:flavodoxin
MTADLRALVIYESMFGNTERLAHAVAAGLQMGGASVVIREVNTAPSVIPSDIDLVVLGAPTHAFSLSRPSTRADAVRQGAPAHRAHLGVREWLSEFSAHSGSGIAIFDTRASKVRRLPMAAGPRAARIARKRGFILLTKPVGFVVEDIKGPLAPNELDRAVKWGRFLAGLARDHVVSERSGHHVSP